MSYSESRPPYRAELEQSQEIGLPPELQFSARFIGRARTGPNSYVFEIERIDGVRFGKSPFIRKMPPCDTDCRAYGAVEGDLSKLTQEQRDRLKKNYGDNSLIIPW